MSAISGLSAHPQVRWAPVVAVVAIGSGVALTSRSASADAGLAPVTAQQLLVDLQQAAASAPTGLSGEVSQTLDLGLPDLSALAGGSGRSGGSASMTSVLSGTHTWRVWLDGPTRQRLALVGDLGESDVYRDGSDVWLWSSKDQTAVHSTLPAQAAGSAHRSGSTGTHVMPTDAPRTPAEAAQLALTALDPTTVVTTTGTDVVAGRPAYELVLVPRDGTSTRVAKVQIAVDSATKLPLRVQVFSTKLANPAIDVGFTKVSFATPPASDFAFTPPPGAAVTEKALPSMPSASRSTSSGSKTGEKASAQATEAAKPIVVGTGWSAVVVATLPTGSKTGSGGANHGWWSDGSSGAGAPQDQLGSVLSALPRVSGAWGSGRVVDGTLFSAVLTDDGRVAVGAVAPAQLYAALAAK